MKQKSTLIHLLLAAIFCVGAFYNASAQIDTITAENNIHQGNGNGLATRTVYDTVVMPHDLSMYGQIKLHVHLSCPTGGCDAWDRVAQIRLWNNGQWYEIGRYVTPYGIACGWAIDVSDYRYMLTDTIILESFIDTWTNPGWLVKLDFEMAAGTPASPAITVQNLWVNYGIVYGDTTQPIVMPDDTVVIRSDADSVKIKMVNTGHGQGNTDNAAEFSQKTHQLMLNGSSVSSELLWRTDCGTNSCSPQNGSWTYNRAGWCPGADVLPYTYNLTSNITPGQTVRLGYQLEDYFNECSPHNPACVTGTTCTDCNYNYNGHTEPNYRISGQLITYHKDIHAGIADIRQARMTISPNPGTGLYKLYSGAGNRSYNVEVYDYLGNVVWQNQTNGAVTSIDLQSASQGVYIVRVRDNLSSTTLKIVKQ